MDIIKDTLINIYNIVRYPAAVTEEQTDRRRQTDGKRRQTDVEIKTGVKWETLITSNVPDQNNEVL